MRVERVITNIIGPNKRQHVKSTFTRGLDLVTTSKYIEDGVTRSKRVMIENNGHNKYMEMHYDSDGRYIKNSFFSSNSSVGRNLDYVG